MSKNAKLSASTTSHYLDLASETLMSNVVGERLKFDRGNWAKGQNEEPMAENTRLSVCMPELQIGWVKFVGGKPVDHRLGYVRDGFKMPTREELGDDDQSLWDLGSNGQPRDPWSQTYIALMRDMDTGELLTFMTNSKGGFQAIAKLCQGYALSGNEEEGLCPVVALSSAQYQHPNPSYGKIWTPKFGITSWAPWTGAAGGDSDNIVRLAPVFEKTETKTAVPGGKHLGTTVVDSDCDDDIPF